MYVAIVVTAYKVITKNNPIMCENIRAPHREEEWIIDREEIIRRVDKFLMVINLHCKFLHLKVRDIVW